MIRRHAMALRTSLVLADAGLAIALAMGVALLRFGRDDAVTMLERSLPDARAAAVIFAGAWVVVLWMHGLYRPRTRWSMRRELIDILRATGVFAVLALAFLYVFKLPDVSRLLLLYLFPSLALVALGSRMAMRLVLALVRRGGRNVRYMLVVGASARGQEFADLVERHRELGLKVIGHIKALPNDNGVALSRPLLGHLDDLLTILHTNVVDEVAICLPFSEQEAIDTIAHVCEEEGKVVRIPVPVLERTLVSGRLEELEGVPVFSLMDTPDRFLGLVAKRALDVIGAVALLVVLSPLFVVVAALIKRDTSGPIHFYQDRVGLHGRPFQVVKFRTMCADAEDQLADLRDQNEINGPAFKIENDPRITRIGRWLRRTSIDELPQLWNVLRGEMSLVGPRPPLPSEVAEYDVWHRRRLSMKPGMTGLWQIGARRESEFDRWVEKDLEYIDRWSLWLDFKIILRTVPAMLQGR